jgi:hypothetical protein
MEKTLICLVIFITSLCFLISCERDLSVSPDETYIKKNAVFVESNPTGAKIFINNKNTGQLTPDTVFWVPSGDLILTLKLDLFKDSSVAVHIDNEDTVSLFLDFTKNKTMLGKFSINSFPKGAEIFINDERTHKVTPQLFNLMPGYYKVKLKLNGFWDEEKTDVVKSAVTTYIEPQFVDTLTWIHYTTGRTDIPSDYLSCVAVEKGYIKWMGTFNAGLVRFDDRIWTIYNMSNSILPDDVINSLVMDDFGNLWVCTDYGVVKKDFNDNWTLYNNQNSGLPENKISTVSFEGQNICFGTLNKGIFIFDGSDWVNYNKSNSRLPSNYINMVRYHNSDLWVLTYNGLAKIKDTSWVIMNDSTSGFPNNNCKTIAFDRTSKPWIGFGYGDPLGGGSAVFMPDTSWTSFRSKPSSDVSSIAVESNNVIWFGNLEYGLSKYYMDSWQTYNNSNSKIGSNIIFGVAVDGNGTKWLASFNKGLIKYKGN